MAVVLTISQIGREITVENWGDVVALLQEEYAHWRWLADDGINFGGAGRSITSAFDQLIQLARNRQNLNDNLADVNNVLDQFLRGPLLHHESEKGALVLGIKEGVGATEAAAAIAFMAGQITLEQVRSPEALRGVMLTAFPDMRTAAEIESRLRRERDNYRSSLRSSIATVEKAQSEREARWKQMVWAAKRLGVSQLRKAKNNAKRLQGGWLAQIGSAVADFRQTEETYKSFMGLRAPAEYWDTKSKEHGTAKTSDLSNVKWYFGILVVVLTALFIASGWLIYHVHDAKNEPVALYVLISGGLAVLSTIGFWIGRILTKLYLSEHHLKTDAEERRVMIMTYLALTENGAASPEEKQIILNAIFRNTSDGIVRDDGPPNVGLQTLASKLLGP